MRIIALTVTMLALAIGISGQRKIIPIVDQTVRGVIGGIEDGKYVSASEVGPLIKKGDRFNWFLPNGLNVANVITEESAVAEPCEDFYFTRFDPMTMGDLAEAVPQGVAIGSGATWNPVPRTPKMLDEAVAKRTYSKSITATLRSKGLTRSVPKNVRAWRVDLEGDGVDEVFVEAGTWAEMIGPSAKPGDYSMLIMRKVVNGKVKETLIAGEFVKRSVEFGAPSRYKLSAIADLNGDGRMEFIIFVEYYEGGGSQAYEIKDNLAIEIPALQAACGV